MPNYITHAVMGNTMEIPNPRLELDRKLLSAFSMGQDLMVSKEGALSETHNSRTRKFFYTLIKMIKDERLYDNPDVLAYLYGHIMHYELDKALHPYVYYMTNNVPKKGIVNFHMALEEYLGDFFVKNKCSLTRRKLSSCANTILDVNPSDQLGKVISKLYHDTYGYTDALDVTKKTVMYIKVLESFKTIMREGKSDAYYKFIGLPKYLHYANMDLSDLTNEDKAIWKNPITMRRSNYSVSELFDLGVELAQDTIEKVNQVIYGNKNISTLDNIFQDESYDTGISCSIGKPFSKSRYLEMNSRTRTR